jgi:hypothetical protein
VVKVQWTHFFVEEFFPLRWRITVVALGLLMLGLLMLMLLLLLLLLLLGLLMLLLFKCSCTMCE